LFFVNGCNAAGSMGDAEANTSANLESARDSQPAHLDQEERMSEDALNVLQNSDDGKELLTAAMALARSKNSDDHRALQGHLTRPAFLGKLDDAEAYKNAGAKRLRISRILTALSENDSPSARAVLLALTRDSNFLKEDIRVDYLIVTTGKMREEADQLVAFWDRYSQPEDGFGNKTVKALVENRTPPAIEVLENKLSDEKHPDEDKLYWMRNFILPHRDDLILLRSFEKLLSGRLPARLRPALVEIIFDYKPQEWYPPADIANPPDRSKIGGRERELLIRIAEISLGLPELNEAQRKAVEDTLEQLKQ
jgi:hypothetical protein